MDIAQIAVRRREIRFELNGPAERGLGFRNFPLFKKSRPECIQRFRIDGKQLDSFAAGRDRLRIAVEGAVNLAEIAVKERHDPVHSDGLLEQLDGPGLISLLMGDEA